MVWYGKHSYSNSGTVDEIIVWSSWKLFQICTFYPFFQIRCCRGKSVAFFLLLFFPLVLNSRLYGICLQLFPVLTVRVHLLIFYSFSLHVLTSALKCVTFIKAKEREIKEVFITIAMWIWICAWYFCSLIYGISSRTGKYLTSTDRKQDCKFYLWAVLFRIINDG